MSLPRLSSALYRSVQVTRVTARQRLCEFFTGAALSGRRRIRDHFSQLRWRLALALDGAAHALAITDRAILAAFELADDTGDLDLEAYDRSQHRLHVIGRCVADVPAIRASLLINLRELCDELTQPHRILDEANRT